MAKGDILSITGMHFWGTTGACHAENTLGQRYDVDVEVCYDMSKSCGSDDINDGYSYSTVFEIAKRVVTTEQYQLLQKLAEEIALQIRAGYSGELEYVKVTVHKVQCPIGDFVDSVAMTVVR